MNHLLRRQAGAHAAAVNWAAQLNYRTLSTKLPYRQNQMSSSDD